MLRLNHEVMDSQAQEDVLWGDCNVTWHGSTFYLFCHYTAASTGMCNFRKTIDCILQRIIDLGNWQSCAESAPMGHCASPSCQRQRCPTTHLCPWTACLEHCKLCAHGSFRGLLRQGCIQHPRPLQLRVCWQPPSPWTARRRQYILQTASRGQPDCLCMPGRCQLDWKCHESTLRHGRSSLIRSLSPHATTLKHQKPA